MNALSTFLDSHPQIAAAVVWPLLTALITWAFKPRSAEELAQLAAQSPKLAKGLAFVSALGVDVPALLDAIRKDVQK